MAHTESFIPSVARSRLFHCRSFSSRIKSGKLCIDVTACGLWMPESEQRMRKNGVKDQKWHRRCDYELTELSGKWHKKRNNTSNLPRDFFPIFKLDTRTKETYKINEINVWCARERVSSGSGYFIEHLFSFNFLCCFPLPTNVLMFAWTLSYSPRIWSQFFFLDRQLCA